jgi:hypothetical protein
MNNIFYKVIGVISIIGITQSYFIYCAYTNYQNKYYIKMKQLIEDKADIKNDVYNRRIEDKVIWNFINIATNLNIDLDCNINDDIFDVIYNIYINNIFIINKKIL